MKKNIPSLFATALLLCVAFNSCKKDDPTITVASIALDKSLASVTIGGTVQLTASIIPANATNANIVWSTTDATKATVSSAGLVTAIVAGTAIITAITADGSKTASCTVSVVSTINIVRVSIPAGKFTMGSPAGEANRINDETQHEVTLSAFSMSKYEITSAEFATFLNEKGIGKDGRYITASFGSQALVNSATSGTVRYNTQWAAFTGYENHPVINVSWYGAMEFAMHVGGRLPTESEWEYAARANSTKAFNTGDCLSNTDANYWWVYPQTGCTNSSTAFPFRTQPVGSYSANAWGLYDMHGNMNEWCSDWSGTYPSSAQTNPTGPSTGITRVYRGGGWLAYAQFCRSASRASKIPDFGTDALGFRVVFAP